MTTTDLIAVIGGFAALLGAVGALLAAFTDAPHAVRHRVEAAPRHRPGADVPTPAAPWRGSPLADTRPIRVAAGPSCRLCRDGAEVIGSSCILCGAQPVMQP